MWYHIYVESKKYNKLVNRIKRSKLTNTENKLVITSGEREGRRDNIRVEGGKWLLWDYMCENKNFKALQHFKEFSFNKVF